MIAEGILVAFLGWKITNEDAANGQLPWFLKRRAPIRTGTGSAASDRHTPYTPRQASDEPDWARVHLSEGPVCDAHACTPRSDAGAIY
jgi:hypothetical protein